MKMDFWIWARAIAAGWITLLLLAFAVEAPALQWTAALIGASWMATVHLALDCAVMTAAGFVAGRSNRAHPMLSAGLLAVSLCFWDFGVTLALNVPWLLRLVRNSFTDSRYLDSLAASAEAHILLFGCLITGAALSRPREKPISIVG
jgi:hypothetical protein